MPKKWEVKWWTQNFQFTWQLLVCYAFKKLWEVVPIKLLFLKPGKFALFQKDYFLDTLGTESLQFTQLRFGQKFLKTPLCKRSNINVNWLFHPLFENRAVLLFPWLSAYQSVTDWLLYMQVPQIHLNIHSMEFHWWTNTTAINQHLQFHLSCSLFRICLEGNTWHPELHYYPQTF